MALLKLSLLLLAIVNLFGEGAGLTLYKRKAATPTLPEDHPRLRRGNGAGAHTPEQVSLAFAGPGAVAIRWVTWPQDDAKHWQASNPNSDAPLLTTSRKLQLTNKYNTLQRHSPRLTHCEKMQQAGLRSVVQWGFTSAVYNFTIEGGLQCYELGDYQSGALHEVIIGEEEGPLPANTTIYYRVGDADQEWSVEYSFTTPPSTSSKSLPYRIGLLGDLGQTEHSLSTLEHLQAHLPDSVILAGDLSYADGYQPRWDSWGRMMAPLTSSSVFMYTEGNHEQERSNDASGDNQDWMSYTSRFHLPHKTSRSESPLYYSYDVAGVHVLMLGSYTDYEESSPQYTWLQRDLAGVDRSRTPWVIVALHAPWYNSNYNHYQEGEGMRQAMEKVLYNNGVDAVIAGHVHAFERSERTFDYKRDPCGPIYINIGDGGNREGLDFDYYDQPDWSAVRDPSYGHGLLEFHNATHAQFSWYRNQDDWAEQADEFWLVRGQDSACIHNENE